MILKIISKIVEIKNLKREDFLKAIYKAKIWERLSPVKEIKVEFISPNVFHSKIHDEVNLVNFPIEMEGELVMIDKGEEAGKGRLIEFNVRNNENVKDLEGNLRVKSLSDNETKIGVFIHKFNLQSGFLNSIGKSASEMIVRTKLNDLLRNLERFCKNNDLKELL